MAPSSILSRSCRSAGILILSALLFACLAESCTTPRHAEPDWTALSQDLDAGWAALWNNDWDTAEKTFAALKGQPRFAAECQRGLALVQYARGDAEGWFKSGVEILGADPSSARSAVLFDMAGSGMDGNLWHPSWTQYMETASGMVAVNHSPWIRKMGLDARNCAMFSGMDKKSEIPKDLFHPLAWNFAGPFDLAWANRKADLDSVMVASAADTLKGSFPLPDGKSGTWSDYQLSNADGSTNPALFFSARNVYLYAHAFQDSPRDGEAWVVLDRDCGLKLWVDGSLLVDDMEFRSGRSMHWVRVKLAKGRHQILAKVLDRGGVGSFNLTLVPVDRDSSFDLAANMVIRTLPGLGESRDGDHLLGKLGARLEGGNSLEGLYFLIQALGSKGYAETALTLLRDEASRVPKNSAFFLHLESMLLRDLGMRREAESKVWETVSKAGDFVPSLQVMAWRAFDQNRFEEVRTLADRMSKSLGKAGYTSRYYQTLADIRLKKDGALNDYHRFMEKYPNDQTLNSALISSGDTGISRSFLAKHLDILRYPPSELGQLWSWLDDGNDDALAAKVAARMKTLFTANPDSWYLSVRSGNMGLLETALEKFPANQTILKFAIYRDIFFYKLLQTQATGGNAASAKALGETGKELASHVGQYLVLNPDNWEFRKLMREADGRSDLDSKVSQTDPREAIKTWLATPEGMDRDVVMVQDETDTFHFPDGGYRAYRSMVLRVGSARGLDWESTQNLPRYDNCNVLEAYSIHPDGSMSWADISGRSVSYPGAQPGDFLVLRYTLDGSYGTGLAGEFWENEYFTDYYPLVHKRSRILFAKDHKPGFVVHNDPLGKVAVKNGTLEDEFDYLDFSVDHLDRQIMRSGKDFRDQGIWLDVSTMENWDKVSQWYSRMADYRAFPDYPIRMKAAELVLGAHDRREKIQRLYDFASNQIRYEDLKFQYSANVPQWADSVMYDRFGDCKDKACLFIALLRAEGIEARFALSEPDYTGPNGYLPSPRFSHAIVIIPGGLTGTQTEGQVIDPTTEFYTFPSLPVRMEGSRYLPIPSQTSSPEEIAPKLKELPVIKAVEHPPVVSYLEAAPRLDRMPVSGILVCREEIAARVRSISQSSDPGFVKQRLRGILAESYPGIEVQSVEASFTGNLDSSPVLKFKATLPPQVRKLKNDASYRMDLPWGMGVGRSLKDLASAMPEGQPLVIDGSMAEVPQTMSLFIQLPSNFFLGIKPADETFTFQNARAKFSYVQEGSLLTCTFELSIPPMTVAAKDVRAFGSFVDDVWNKQSEYLLLGAGF